mgnify:CR=1 FL=1
MTDKLPSTIVNTAQAMDIIWDALRSYEEIAEMLRDHVGADDFDEYFEDINTAMVLIQEELYE